MAEQGQREPRLRVNRTASLALTTTWQTIDFNGTSTYNVNTFGKDPVSGNNLVWWDSANQLMRFYEQYDRNYKLEFYANTITTILTTKASLQYRLVVPNGVSPGVDIYFPFPELGASGAYADVGEVTLLATGVSHGVNPQSLYLIDAIRTNGVKLQLRLSNNLFTLGTCTLTSCNLLIQ